MAHSLFELHSDETIRLVVRRHKLSLFLEFLPIVFMVAAVIAALAMLKTSVPALWEKAGIYIWFVLPLLGLMITIKSFALIIDWLLDVSVLTNQRLITIHQHSLFHRQAAALQLERIQDVVVEVKGVLEHFFHFGTVTIQTASETIGFVLDQVADPFAVKEAVMQLVNERTQNSSQKYEAPPPVGIDI